jgi:hypothetical protein
LPSRNHFSDFFEKLEPEILRLLFETRILENFAGIVDQFSLFPASYAVSKLAALAQALITLVSVNSLELHEHPEHPEQLT